MAIQFKPAPQSCKRAPAPLALCRNKVRSHTHDADGGGSDLVVIFFSVRYWLIMVHATPNVCLFFLASSQVFHLSQTSLAHSLTVFQDLSKGEIQTRETQIKAVSSRTHIVHRQR